MSACTNCGEPTRRDSTKGGWTMCRRCYERNKALRLQLRPLRWMLDAPSPLGPPSEMGRVPGGGG
jgi:hypothetical protein